MLEQRDESRENFLADIADAYNLQDEPRDVFLKRFAYKKEGKHKNDEGFAKERGVDVTTIRTHMKVIYGVFAKSPEKPYGCDIDPSQRGRGKFNKLYAWLWNRQGQYRLWKDNNPVWQQQFPSTPISKVEETAPKEYEVSPTQHNNIPSNIPRTGAVEFLGRSHELQTLHQLLQQGNPVAIAAVAGMGGVGKTELAIQYAREKLRTYQGGVCWLQARSGDIGIELVQFAKGQLGLTPRDDVDLPTQVRFCWQNWLAGEVLLVLDDINNYQLVKPYLPPASCRFKVLITTRLQLGSSIEQLSLDVLKPLTAMDLSKSLVGRERIKREPWVARRLCKWLGYLPLGLELVGRYLKRKQDLSLAEILSRLKAKRLEELSLKKPKTEDDMTAQLGVAAAFELSWQELNDQAKQLGCLLSLFALAPIPWQLVEKCLPNIDPLELEETRDESLLTLHLVQRKEKEIYQLHQLMREFFHQKLEELAQSNYIKHAFVETMVALAKKIPWPLTLTSITVLSPDIPHLAETASHLTIYLKDDDLITPFEGLSKFYMGQGLYSLAEIWLKQCLTVAQDRLNSEHPDVATSLNNLASFYNSQERYQEAEPLLLQALELRLSLLGEEDPDVATSLNNLAFLYTSQGRYEKAEPLYIQVLDIRQRQLGEEHSLVAISLNNLAYLYYCQGLYNKAEPLYLQALAIRRSLLQEEHPYLAVSLENLGRLYHDLKRYVEAESLYLQALELRQHLLGEVHPDVVSTLNNLAQLYKSQGRYQDAEQLLVKALVLSKRLLKDGHSHLVRSLNNLAALYKLQGRYQDAEPLCVEALELKLSRLGEEHPDVADSLNHLAFIYCHQGRYQDAEPLYIQTLELRQRLFGEEHLDVAESLNNLAHLYYSQEHYSEAEPLFVQALAMRQRLLPQTHPSVAQSLNNLGAVYYYQGRYEEAEPLYVQALELIKSQVGEEHPDVAQSLNNLAQLYQSQNRYKEAEQLYREALVICERTLGQDHPLTSMYWENFVIFLRQAILENRVNLEALQANSLGQAILNAIKAEFEQTKN